MLKSLADTIDQLDLAAEHIAIGDVNNVRFGLMLTDNALELVLHNIARDDAADVKHYSTARGAKHPQALEKAQGQSFAPKVRYGQLLHLYDAKVGETLLLCHLFRNELYHAGIQHEAILKRLARFHFHVVCTVLSERDPGYFSWGSNQRLPERSKKYFAGPEYFPGTIDQYKAACLQMAATVGHDPQVFVEALADHMEAVVEDQDRNIEFIETDAPQSLTRDQVVVSCQSWPLTATKEVETAMAAASFVPNNLFEAVSWIETNFPIAIPKDPIPGWTRRVADLRRTTDCHAALKAYRSFMDQTATFRRWLDDDAMALDRSLQLQIDMRRGK